MSVHGPEEADVESARCRGYLIGKEHGEKLLGLEVAALRQQLADQEAAVRELTTWANLCLQYMEKGEPWWYGDMGLKEQGRAALAKFPEAPDGS